MVAGPWSHGLDDAGRPGWRALQVVRQDSASERSLDGFYSSPRDNSEEHGDSDTWRSDLPDVTLSAARFWTLVGTFTVKPDGKLEFKEATQAERDAEWTKLSKTTPPPVVKPTATVAPIMPFSSPAAQPSASPASTQAQRALQEKIERARGALQQQQQSTPRAAPTASP